MRDWPTSAARWIRRLVRSDEATPAASADERIISSGALSVLALEAMACNALCLQTKRGSWRRDEAHSALALNAFGKPVAELHYEGARAAFASACGLVMTGTRAATFLSGDRLTEVHDQLYSAAGRRLPVVIHAACRAVPRQSRAFGSGHEGYHAVAATGAFLAFARNAQHAADLTLAAHRIAELSLTPGIVAMDGPETAGAAQDLVLPTPELITAYLGAADAWVDSPTEAQRMVFGQRRPHLPRWFDLDRPAAFGTAQAGDDYGVASAGRKLFFDMALPALAELALSELSAVTGRPLGFVHTHAIDHSKGAKKTRHVLVAQGSVVELAEAVADHVAESRSKKARVGVLSIDFLRPFPTAAVAAALADAEIVTVLERADDPLGQTPPLQADVAAAISGSGTRVLSAVYGVGGKTVTVADVLAVCDNMAAADPKPAVFLGMASRSAKSRLPKRQVLLDGVHRAYPQLDDHLLASGEAVDLRPEGARSVSVHCEPSTVPEEGLSTLANALTGVVGPYVRSRSHLVAHRVWAGVVTVAKGPLRDLGDEVSVHAAFVSSLDLPGYVNPCDAVVTGGAVVLRLGFPTDTVFGRLPASWQKVIKANNLQVFNATQNLSELGEALAALVSGGTSTLDVVPHTRSAAAAPAASGAGPQLPLLIKRINRNDTEYDNPSRFWGEVVQPRMLGERPQALPDPYLAVGGVPASTATFRDASLSRSQLPVVAAEKCTGCGICWIACPDSSLGPVAVSVQGLLDSAATLAGTDGAEAAKLRRSHGKLGTRVNSLLAESGAQALKPMMIREAFTWLSDKGTFTAEEKPAVDAAFDQTVAALETLPIAVTAPFFGKAEAGSGEVFVLGVNPQTCQGCTSCVINCPEAAIEMAPQDDALLARSGAGWRMFEALPDTPLPTIERVRADLGLAAVHLQRNCHLAVAGGGSSEPGSGARLASRLVSGAIEFRASERMRHLEKSLAALVARLRATIRDGLAGAFDVENLDGLGDALAGVAGRAASIGELVDQLEQRGDSARVDAVALRRSAKLAAALDKARENIATGPNGIGRARMGLVVSSGEVGEWAARFPHNPFYAPLAVDLGGDGAELAAGIAQGLLDRFLDLFRMARRAELRIAAKPDLSVREKELAHLTWRDLTHTELACVPPLVLLADAESLGTKGLSGLSQLLSSDLPVRVVLLDRRADIGAHVDPTLFGLAHRRAFVLAASIAHPEHLFDGVVAALDFNGPALIHVIAPSPSRDGFATGTSRDRARLAVETRVHPLLTYNPVGDGVFGARIDLSANPEPGGRWVIDGERGALTPAHWAVGHGRASGDLALVDAGAETEPVDAWLDLAADERAEATPVVLLWEDNALAVLPRLVAEVEDRRDNWTTLQELAGLVTPFTRQVRETVESDLASSHRSDLASQAQSYEAQLAESREQARQAQVEQLQRRLLELAGYAGPPAWFGAREDV